MKKNQSATFSFFYRHAAQIILIGIIFTAVFFRFYQLTSLPPALSWLEASVGVSAQKLINAHSFQFFYSVLPDVGWEGLFVFLQAASIGLFGNTSLALRVMPALLGVLTVIFTYLWAKNWFGRRIGLISAFLLAINTWVVVIARSGLRANLIPFLMAAFAFLGFKAYSTKKAVYAVLAGIALSLGLYVGIQMLALWLAVFLIFLYILISRRGLIKDYKKLLIAFILAASVTILPLALQVAQKRNQTAYAGLSNKVVVLAKDRSAGQKIRQVVENKTKVIFGMFNFGRGDQNPQHNVVGEPFLNLFVALMWALGLVIIISRLGRLKYLALLLIFICMSLPSVLTLANAPNGLQLLGAAPAIMIMAGLGVDYMLVRWYQTFPVNNIARSVGLIMITVLLVLSAYQSYKAYFVAYAGEVAVYNGYNEDMTQIAASINASPSDQAYVITSPQVGLIIDYLKRGQSNSQIISIDQLRSLPIKDGKRVFYVSAIEDDAAAKLDLLKAKFPNGRAAQYYSNFDSRQLYYIYTVEK